MSKHIDKKKVIKTLLLTFLISVIVLAYPIYAVIIWNISGSPDDISKFPSSDVWICETENFVITIDLQSLEENENSIENMKVTIKFNGEEQALFCYQTGGHGTPLTPVKPSHILNFESKDIENFEENYIQFKTHKYKFNENDFYLLDIYITKYNQVDFLKDKMDLHFIKSIID